MQDHSPDEDERDHSPDEDDYWEEGSGYHDEDHYGSRWYFQDEVTV